MTEAEWLVCDDPRRMIEFLGSHAGDRKLQLFSLAVLTLEEMASDTNQEYRIRIEIAGQFADSCVSVDILREHWGENAWPERAREWAVEVALGEINEEPRRVNAIVQLFHDIFGNPFRPVTFSRSWRTDTAVTLARQMYESRDFSAMPILADALQDAGCNNEDILDHCRDAKQVHVRGCWVVDWVLKKE